MKPTLVIASANPDKVAELRELLGDRFDVVARPDDAPDTIEDQPTLLGNATKKAVEIMQFTGLAALADDTGLFVDALDGRPGVFTARYAGENATYAENVAKLLHELDGVTNRRAEFRTCVVVAYPDGRVVDALGVVVGDIATAETGDGGFGYDPVFVPHESDGRSFAEMDASEKHQISHRSRALANLP
ncbi:MAG: RdgB/HAM1 family non-canonical purine NTP pyrophosphatase [Acidimicrobiales bacterium]